MPKNLKLTIIKEPNDANNTNFRKEFPYLGNIYLELLENHKKIKKECIFSGALNKEPILKLEDYKKVRTQQLRNDSQTHNDTQQNNKLFHVDENTQYKTDTTKEYETENVVLDKYDEENDEKLEYSEENNYEADEVEVDDLDDFDDSQEEQIHIMNKEDMKSGTDEVDDRLNEMLKQSNNDELTFREN